MYDNHKEVNILISKHAIDEELGRPSHHGIVMLNEIKVWKHQVRPIKDMIHIQAVKNKDKNKNKKWKHIKK